MRLSFVVVFPSTLIPSLHMYAGSLRQNNIVQYSRVSYTFHIIVLGVDRTVSHVPSLQGCVRSWLPSFVSASNKLNGCATYRMLRSVPAIIHVEQPRCLINARKIQTGVKLCCGVRVRSGRLKDARQLSCRPCKTHKTSVTGKQYL